MFLRGTVAAALVSGFGVLLAVAISKAGSQPGAVPTSSEVSERVMSPFCPGLSLDECPSSQAEDLRAEIRRRTASGATNREIDRWLVAQYGEVVLAKPPHVLAWIVPLTFILAGLFAVSFSLVRLKSMERPAQPAEQPSVEEQQGAPDSDALRARMLDDLAVFGKGTE